jgi:hypothetical protein
MNLLVVRDLIKCSDVEELTIEKSISDSKVGAHRLNQMKAMLYPEKQEIESY